MNEKTAKNRNYFYIIVLGVLLFAIYNLFGAGIQDDGAGVDSVRSGIEQGVQSNRELQDGIGNATETVDRLADVLDRSETTVDAAKGTAESLDRNLETAADAIAKCQSIVNGIKQRNEGTKTKP